MLQIKNTGKQNITSCAKIFMINCFFPHCWILSMQFYWGKKIWWLPDTLPHVKSVNVFLSSWLWALDLHKCNSKFFLVSHIMNVLVHPWAPWMLSSTISHPNGDNAHVHSGESFFNPKVKSTPGKAVKWH